MTRLQQIALLLVACGAFIQGYPVERYNPYIYYGPSVRQTLERSDYDYIIPSPQKSRGQRQRFRTKDFDFESPLDLSDPNIGPEIEKMLESYVRSTDFEGFHSSARNGGYQGQESNAELERMLLSYEMLKEFEDRMADAQFGVQADGTDMDEEPSPELLRVLDAYKELKDFENRRFIPNSAAPLKRFTEEPRQVVDTDREHKNFKNIKSVPKNSPAPVKRSTEKPMVSSKIPVIATEKSTEAPFTIEIATELGMKDGDEKSKVPNVTSTPLNVFEVETPSKNDTDPLDELDASTSNRRTFQLLVPAVELGMKMIDADLGLGLTDASGDTYEQERSRARARAQQAALRESQEKLELERLKTQTELQQLKTESEIISKNTQMELSSIKTKLDQVSEQTAKERREKEELQIKLEHEAKLRERDNQEMKNKLQSEARLREMERTKFQSQLAQEQTKRERERMELKNKMEMEAAMQEIKMKKSSQESKSAYDTKVTTQYIIHDYRAPVMQYPPTVTNTQGPTVGFV